MKSLLLLRIPPPVFKLTTSTVVQWCEYTVQGEMVGELHICEVGELFHSWMSHKDLSQSEESLGDTEKTRPSEEGLPDGIVVLLPDTVVVHRSLAINSGQRKHLKTALPFMIEELLAEDIDGLHITNRLSKKGDRVRVSVISHELMQGLLDLLNEQHLSPSQILAECQLVPISQTLNILMERDIAYFCEPDEVPVLLDYDALRWVLKARNSDSLNEDIQVADLDQHEEDSVSQATLIVPDQTSFKAVDQQEQVESWLTEAGITAVREPYSGSAFEYLAANYFACSLSEERFVDLRTGVYKCPDDTQRKVQRWKAVASIAAVWLFLELGFMVGEGGFFHNKAEDFWLRGASLYLEAFPNDRQVAEAYKNQKSSVNLKSRMESRIQASGMALNVGTAFLPILQKISAVSASLQDIGLEPVSLEFSNSSGAVVLDVNIDTLEGVNQLVTAMKSSGLNTQLDGANQEKDVVRARLSVSNK